MLSIECESTENLQKYLETTVLLEKNVIFAVVLTTNNNRIMTYAFVFVNFAMEEGLETVSKCLGHSSTQITQAAYSKLLKETIIKEVSKVF